MSKIELELNGLKLVADGLAVNKKTEQVVGTKSTPLYLEVDTGVDYAAVVTGIAGLIVAVLAAWFTLGVQRNQIQANVSTLRHHWMNEVRACASELLQVMSVLANHMKQVENYKGSSGYVEQMKAAIILENKIALLLSRDDEVTTSILAKIKGVMGGINNLKYKNDNQLIFRSMQELKELFRAELEDAWGDIKNDLGVNKRFLGVRYVANSRSK